MIDCIGKNGAPPAVIPDEKIVFYDGILHIIFGKGDGGTVYSEKIICGGYDDPVTLKDIENDAEQVGARTILVIYENATYGDIYRFGNYNPKTWQRIGTTIGYA